MKTILLNWNLMRGLRLMLGIIIIVQGIGAKEWMYALAGIILCGMAIANIGCCGVGGCQVSTKKENTNATTKEIIYEEVH